MSRNDGPVVCTEFVQPTMSALDRAVAAPLPVQQNAHSTFISTVVGAKAEAALRTHAGCMQPAYDRMQPAYDRMQPAYDRRRPACRRRHPAFYGVDAGMTIVIIRRE